MKSNSFIICVCLYFVGTIVNPLYTLISSVFITGTPYHCYYDLSVYAKITVFITRTPYHCYYVLFRLYVLRSPVFITGTPYHCYYDLFITAQQPLRSVTCSVIIHTIEWPRHALWRGMSKAATGM